MPVRKNPSRRRRKNSRAKFIILVLIIALLAFSVSVWQIVRIVKNAVWDGQSRVNLVLDAQDIYLISFDPGEEMLLVVSVPGKTYVEATFGFGSYPFGAVYDLGEIEKIGGRLLTSTAQEFFATPVDAWLKSRDEKLTIDKEAPVKEEILNLIRAAPGTNLTFWDKLRLWWQIRQTRFDKIKVFNFGADDLNPEKIDQVLAPFLTEGKIKEEMFKIEILNSTDKVGLGARISRFINNLGGEVINVGNQEGILPTCVILVRKGEAGSFTPQRLKKIFSCQIKEIEVWESRGDLVLIIGNDYWERLTQRESN